MNAKDFAAWIDRMSFSDSEVARRLDLSRNTVAEYRSEGAPRSVALACAAIEGGLDDAGLDKTEVEPFDSIVITRRQTDWGIALRKKEGGLVFRGDDRGATLSEALKVVGSRFFPS